MRKLEKRGHAGYHGYVAVHEQHGGFCVSFFEAPPYSIGFCEIAIWFRPSVANVDVVEIVRSLASVIPVDYGYSSELAENQNPVTESTIRRGLFGGLSVNVGTNALSKWHRAVQTICKGGIRDVYPINFLNHQQVDRFRQLGNFACVPVAENLCTLCVEDAGQRDDLRKRLFDAQGEAG